jgi:hypothetical protein
VLAFVSPFQPTISVMVNFFRKNHKKTKQAIKKRQGNENPALQNNLKIELL